MSGESQCPLCGCFRACLYPGATCPRGGEEQLLGKEGGLVGLPNASDYALSDIAEIERNGDISADLAQRGRDVVGLIFQPGSTYATIAPIDDGDLSFYWVAGDWSISIDLYAEGGGWYRARQGGLSVRSHEGGTPEWMWDALQEFSERVERLNPTWRELRTG